MILQGLNVNLPRLRAIQNRVDATKTSSIGSSYGTREQRKTRHVSEAVIADTRGRYAHVDCKCEDLGLSPGMLVAELTRLSSGCCTQWICPRLDAVRRAYGV